MLKIQGCSPSSSPFYPLFSRLLPADYESLSDSFHVTYTKDMVNGTMMRMPVCLGQISVKERAEAGG